MQYFQRVIYLRIAEIQQSDLPEDEKALRTAILFLISLGRDYHKSQETDIEKTPQTCIPQAEGTPG